MGAMTMLIKLFSKFTMLFFLTIFYSLTYAETLITEPLDKDAATQKKQSKPLGTAVSGAGNVTPIIRSGDAPQVMSCWQYGKLILEQPIVPPKEKSNDIRMLHNPQTGKEVLAYDFKSAFCFIK